MELIYIGKQLFLMFGLGLAGFLTGAQSAEKAAKFRLHHHVQDVSGNC